MEINSVSRAISVAGHRQPLQALFRRRDEPNRQRTRWQNSWHPHFIRDSQSPRQGLGAHPMTTLKEQAPETFVRVTAGNTRVSSSRKSMINWLIYMLNDICCLVLISPKFCYSLRMQQLYFQLGISIIYIHMFYSFLPFNGKTRRSSAPQKMALCFS